VSLGTNHRWDFDMLRSVAMWERVSRCRRCGALRRMPQSSWIYKGKGTPWSPVRPPCLVAKPASSPAQLALPIGGE
jgi:hypothetical protein